MGASLDVTVTTACNAARPPGPHCRKRQSTRPPSPSPSAPQSSPQSAQENKGATGQGALQRDVTFPFEMQDKQVSTTTFVDLGMGNCNASDLGAQGTFDEVMIVLMQSIRVSVQ